MRLMSFAFFLLCGLLALVDIGMAQRHRRLRNDSRVFTRGRQVTFSLNVLPTMEALDRMTAAERREWADCYDELADALRKKYPGAAGERRFLAEQIMARYR